MCLQRLNPDVLQAVVRRAEKTSGMGQGISQSLEQEALRGTVCSGLCMCEFIFQMKVLDTGRLCLLSKVTGMKNKEWQGSS